MSKPPCKYGSKCFITNPLHLMRFSHSKSVIESPEKSGAKLVDLCSSQKIATSPMVEDFSHEPGGPLEEVQILDLVSPTKNVERKLKLKKRLHMEDVGSSSSEKEEDVFEFESVLSAGAFRGDMAPVSDVWLQKSKLERSVKTVSNKTNTKKSKKKKNKKDSKWSIMIGSDDDDDDGGGNKDDDIFDDDEGNHRGRRNRDDEENEELPCQHCGLWFDSFYDLERHVKSDHARRMVTGGDDDDDDDDDVLDLSPVRSKVSSEKELGRSARLRKRNERKTLAPIRPQKEEKSEPAYSGPATFAELVSLCKDVSKSIKEELRVDPESIGLLAEQPKGLKEGRVMKQHQLQGLNWLYLLHSHKLNAILADEMGLGKTVQAISLLTLLKDRGEDCSAIVVVPASVISNWFSEIERWSPNLKVILYYGTKNDRANLQLDVEESGEKADVYLTTYTTVINDVDRRWLRHRKVQYLIVDEAHEVRNAKSLRHKALDKLGASRRILLTGTPFHNNLTELLTLLYFLNPKLFGNYRSFESLLDGAEAQTQKDAQDKIIPAIRDVLSPFMLRRLKKDVLTLPAKKSYRIRCFLAEALQKDVYESVSKSSKSQWAKESVVKGGQMRNATNILMELRKAANHPLLLPGIVYDEQKREEVVKIMHRHVPPYYDWERQEVTDLVQTLSDFQIHELCSEHEPLKQYALDLDLIINSSGKMQALMQLLDQFQSKGQRALVFSQMTRFLDIVQFILASKNILHLRLDGQTPVLERQDLIDTFDSDTSIRVFLLSTKAGGIGINLTAAQCVVFLDLSFNPQWDRQAEDRAHRIGQEHEVSVYKFITTLSIDENIFAVQKEKLKLHDELLQEGVEDDGSGEEKTNTSEVWSLLHQYFTNRDE